MFDFIVVGGGSAGCVLAHRLSSQSKNSVLLIEAGRNLVAGKEPPEIRDTYSRAPYRSENLWPDLQVRWLGDAKAPRRYEQARILGGGSTINAMVAIRGMPDDFAEWERSGATRWGWSDVLPYFCRLERDVDYGANAGHGSSGPMPIRRHPRPNWPPFSNRMAEIVQGRGYPLVEDMNTDFHDGVCFVPLANLPSGRVSAAAAYLDSATRARSNLRIVTDNLVTRLVLEGKKAVGVEVSGPGGKEVIKGREIILTAGAIQTPLLLQRSGIGPAAVLSAAGVGVVVDASGVGENLHDHPAVAVAAHLHPAARQPATFRSQASVALRFSSNLDDCPPGDMYMAIANRSAWHPLGRHLGALVVSVYKPFSRGHVRIARGEATDIVFNILDDVRDSRRLKHGLVLAHELASDPQLGSMVTDTFPASFSERVRRLNKLSHFNWVRSAIGAAFLSGPSALRRYLIKQFISPGPDFNQLIADDKLMADWIRSNATGFYHPVGTCRMGAPSDPKAVVDPECRLIGIAGLRVADASVMPAITRANTNITTMMIAEKVSDHIGHA